ncbi:MAG: AAA family ATPase [bacterium]|nr:AAA family ATPase [bacterium]
MIQLPGYEVNEQIYKSKNSTIYRGVQTAENRPVVIKVLEKEYPTAEQLARFRREYEITCKLEGEGIIRACCLEKYDSSLAIILEDFGADSLERELPRRQPGLEEKLSLAIQMTEALSQVHQQDIIHKDITLSNFVWNSKTKRLKIIDFGISTELTKETPEACNPNILEGTLNYISPEQTGRMNRVIDYRTDIYSLGVAFYKVFTGQLPFQSDDTMELVHCHLAKIPEEPTTIDPEIPAVLSAIIQKLLSKTAEERYQNTYGLISDLEQCLDQLRSGGSIREFEIARNDLSRRFQIPQKLYGREEGTGSLLRAFERVAAGSKEMILVAGGPGVGKSALVHEVNKPITEKRGNFISGKFDQYKRNIPYSAFIHAFGELVKSLLAEPEGTLHAWKEKLCRALGESGQVVIDVIPEVELIMGKQPPVQKLEPEQARNRFHLVFRSFIRVFAGKESPLVIFMDDLQWADGPSLRLIEQFMTDMNTGHVLIIGAYRDTEVDASHSVSLLLEILRKAGSTINMITLAPLGIDHINELIADTLLCDKKISYPFAELCLQKTYGNPFFMKQLLYSLYEEGHIDFNETIGHWQYDMIEIWEVDITDNVVELMSGKIRKLPKETEDMLKLASCAGNLFDLDTLAVISEKPKNEAARALFGALKGRLIVPTDDSYKFISALTEPQEHLNVSYRFLHDRIQQAAYSLIEQEHKQEVHLKIGRLLLQNLTEEEQDDKIFEIVNHLNRGIDYISDRQEKDRLAQLNLRAGQKAKKSAAYKPAYEYFTTGIELMGALGWKREYRLMLTLHEGAGESACLSGYYEESERNFVVITQNAKTVFDMVRGYEIRILDFISQVRYKEAVEAGLEILRQLGTRFPARPKKRHLLVEFLKIKLILYGKTDEDLLLFKKITDPIALAQDRIFQQISSPIFLTKPELFPFVIFKGLRIFMKYGIDPSYASSVFAAFGVILCSIGSIENGYRFGRLSETMLTRSGFKRKKTRVLTIMNSFIRHWKEHIRETLQPLYLAYESRLETGDIEYASHSVLIYSYYIFFSGNNLKEVEKEQRHLRKVISMMQQKGDWECASVICQVTRCLVHPGPIAARFSDTDFDEDTIKSIIRKEENIPFLLVFYYSKMTLCYFAGEYEEGLNNSLLAKKYLGSTGVLFSTPSLFYFQSLIRLALCDSASAKEKRKHLKQAARAQKKIKKWAAHGPMNHLHKWHLVEAETAKVLGNNEQAKEHYRKALELARANEYIQEEALAYERYSLFLLQTGEKEFAGFTMKKARYCYSIWGAAAKVFDLEKRYPELLKDAAEATGETITVGSTATASPEVLDLSTIMKATRAISQEIVLANFLVRLMAVSMENAGAEKGFMVLEEKGKLYIEAEAITGREEISVLKSIPVDEHPGLCSAMVNFVARTREVLILNNASAEGNFVSDPYVVANKPKSILCFPLLDRGELSGILYLENNLLDSAFTPRRLEVLEILSSQAAISIDNARLYENLEEKVVERTRQLKESNYRLSKAIKALWGEMELAKKIQTALLPWEPEMEGYEIITFMEPADDVGGDYYDIINCDGVDWVIIGDVSGHGVPAGLIMMMVQTAIRSYAQKHPETNPSDLLAIVNETIKYNMTRMQDEKYMTITAFSFRKEKNRKEGNVLFAGNHVDLLVYRAGTGAVDIIETDGLWLSTWDMTMMGKENLDKNFTLELEPGDTLLLYTDGITEAMDENHEMFSLPKLAGILERTGSLLTEAIRDAVLYELTGYTVQDDVTMVIIRKK